MSNEKTAGLLDTPHDELAPDVWEKDRTLKPHIKRQIQEQLYSVLPEDHVKQIFIIGSITGYKYEDDTDIDVNVATDPYDEGTGKTYLTRKINGETAIGTDRPINYFVSEWRDDTIENYSKVAFGVYSATQDKWISSPGSPKGLRDPKEEFWIELKIARAIARKFERYVKDWKKDIREYERMKRKGVTGHALHSQKTEIEMGRERLKDIIRQADEERKMAYAVGWGVARNSEENLIFKYLEHGEYEDLFKKLRDEVDKENIERAEARNEKIPKPEEKEEN